jgi:small GTP-binding protein
MDTLTLAEARKMHDDDKLLKAKICLVGDSRVGKTSLIRRYVHDEFDDGYISTLGAKISKKEIVLDSEKGAYRVQMTVWDIMGEKGLTDLLKDSYFDGTGGLVAVCDLTRQDTLEGLEDWIMTSDSQIGRIPMTFVGNKLDLRGEMDVGTKEISDYARSHDSPYFLTSAKTGENVNAVFLELAKRVLKRTYGDL